VPLVVPHPATRGNLNMRRPPGVFWLTATQRARNRAKWPRSRRVQAVIATIPAAVLNYIDLSVSDSINRFYFPPNKGYKYPSLHSAHIGFIGDSALVFVGVFVLLNSIQRFWIRTRRTKSPDQHKFQGLDGRRDGHSARPSTRHRRTTWIPCGKTLQENSPGKVSRQSFRATLRKLSRQSFRATLQEKFPGKVSGQSSENSPGKVSGKSSRGSFRGNPRTAHPHPGPPPGSPHSKKLDPWPSRQATRFNRSFGTNAHSRPKTVPERCEYQSLRPLRPLWSASVPPIDFHPQILVS
jgi:hypothetical protein